MLIETLKSWTFIHTVKSIGSNFTHIQQFSILIYNKIIIVISITHIVFFILIPSSLSIMTGFFLVFLFVVEAVSLVLLSFWFWFYQNFLIFQDLLIRLK